MGACLNPTADMRPWFNVEVSGGHAELTATTYLHGWYRIREESDGDLTDEQLATAYTDEERSAAWITYASDTFATPAAPLSAFLATLRQIADHPAYGRWKQEGGQPRPTGARAEMRDDGRVLITGPFIRHPSDRDGDLLQSVELLYGDVAALLDAVTALTPGR
ncbi:hypothetical protein J7E96_19290 [Streptomyces sp. ISL-96]|uniref:hypothetical protein n=1 Tax=Streptomyces sp. ISL-96 TaxID=2819191 RepID=UPI001BE825C2|nr:hypothetical protein [Streptomyces sp. ISL-96]MBT2490619.1 hypothetical protein [Streptomyces sp. ISL-96]